MVEKRKTLYYGLGTTLLILLMVFSVEIPLEDRPLSKMLLSKDGYLLAARVSSDEQWRFEQPEKIVPKFFDCVKEFEDAYFQYHLGVNPASLLKAFWHNINQGKVKRGGSTLSMQVVRMARNRGERSYWQKCLEVCGAIQLELRFSKREIFHFWCQLAPFGGNVVGAETAAWRYYGRSLQELSWAESSLLAVLPNSPALIHPGRNREELRNKRNRLLRKLAQEDYFDTLDLPLYLAEEIPSAPLPVPTEGLHLLDYCIHRYPSKNIFESTVSREIQAQVMTILENHLESLNDNGIRAVSAVVIDSKDGALISYVGNLPDRNDDFRFLDLNQAPRSYGSLLKPFLYAYAIQEGYLLPEELVADIPTVIDGFQPQNFDKKFRGTVPFSYMVNQSLNVPAVRTLNLVGYREFFDYLTTLKLDFLDKGAEHYGLSIILGGGESNLFSLTRAYHFLNRAHQYSNLPISSFRVLKKDSLAPVTTALNKAVVGDVVDAMTALVRPGSERGWQRLSSGRKIAWKTGTSYGFRDAWTIGFDGRFTVGVWVGNEDGESREGLTGVEKAAPVFFEIINNLPGSEDLRENRDSKNHQIEICLDSNKKAGWLCPRRKTIGVHQNSERRKFCEYHRVGRKTEEGKWKPLACLDREEDRDTIFYLPTFMGHYYKSWNMSYDGLPAILQDCNQALSEEFLNFIYPTPESHLVLPLESNGERRSLVAEASCGLEEEVVFWFLDGLYLDETQGEHRLNLTPNPGDHEIKVVGSSGGVKTLEFKVVWP